MNTVLNIKNILLGVLVAALFLTAGVAYAEETDTASVDVRTRADVRLNLSPEEVERLRMEAEQRRKEAMEAVEAKRIEIRANIDTRRTDIRTDIDARRAEIRTRIDTRRGVYEENAEDREEIREERRREIRAMLQERASARVHLHLDRFTTILDAAIDRMYGLIDRITLRADAMDEDGHDTSTAREYLDLAVSELVAAEADLTAIEADLDASLSADVEISFEALREIFASTKDAIDSAKRHIRAAHAAVRDAVASLKAEVEVETEIEAEVEEE